MEIMTARVHRVLITLGSFLAGLGGLLALPDNDILGIPPEVGAAVTLGAAVAMLAANAIRSSYPKETAAS